MAFKIEERFEVQAPVERVWKYLIDPAQVVQCLPGAELLGSEADDTFLGALKVKVGPLSMTYKGKAQFTELDEQAHMVRMVGEAREIGGTGSTKMTMVSTVVPGQNGGSAVVVNVDVDLVGKIVQFGRGMIEEVSKQMFRQFSNCMKAHLEIPEVAQEAAAETANSSDTQNAGDTNNNLVAEQTRIAPPEVKPVGALSITFRALWAIVSRFFRRLIGKSTA